MNDARFGVALLPTTLACVFAVACAGEPPLSETRSAVSYLPLAQFWSPVIYQDTHEGMTPYPMLRRCDYITNFDYDGDYSGNNNWENLTAFSQPGYVYYSVSATRTHWFVGYAFFHPQDCDSGPHENDLEGIVLAIRRDETRTGTLEHVISVAHDHMYQYTTVHDRWRYDRYRQHRRLDRLRIRGLHERPSSRLHRGWRSWCLRLRRRRRSR